MAQYLDCFGASLAIIDHDCVMREGEHLLTPALAQDLTAYSRDELTCATLVIVARKPA